MDLWFTRASSGYAGKGSKPQGLEHYAVARARGVIRIQAEIAFQNYGEHHLSVSTGGTSRAATSRFTDHGRGVTLDSKLARGTWTIVGADGWSGSLDAASDALPSLSARLLPQWLPRTEGEVASYFVVPEDGWPAWRPPGKGSFFPLMGAGVAGPRTVVCRGIQSLQVRTRVRDAWCYEHIDRGAVAGTTWIDPGNDEVIAYLQEGLVLERVDEDAARLRLPPGIRLTLDER